MSNELTTSGTFDLSPKTFEQALTFANYLADSDMVPKDFKGKPGNCLIAMQWGMEVGLKPLQALQNISVINGKPGLYGDAGKAILLAAGCIIEEDDIALVERNKKARCIISRPGRPPVERTYSLENAKTAGLWGKGGPWSTSPWRQMAWRAFWFAARDAASDMLKGLSGAEEVMDSPREATVPAPATEYIDPQMFIDSVGDCATDADALAYWKAHNGKLAKQPADHAAFKAAVAERRTELKNAGATDVQAKPAATPASKTFDEVMAGLCGAKSLDELYTWGDWIETIEGNDLLNQKFNEMQTALEAA